MLREDQGAVGHAYRTNWTGDLREEEGEKHLCMDPCALKVGGYRARGQRHWGLLKVELERGLEEQDLGKGEAKYNAYNDYVYDGSEVPW